jgi:glucose/arabinose dehydrogenase
MTMAAACTRFAEGFDFPTSLVFDGGGTPYVAESGLPFGGARPGGRLWEIDGRAGRRLVAEGFTPPVTGLLAYGDALYVSEGGAGRITRVERDGSCLPVVAGLPGPGNYHTNMAVVGPDGRMYFSQGAMTNTGVVGLDAYEVGWLRSLPHAHDLPGYDVVLAGQNFETDDPLSPVRGARTRTGAFCSFGRVAPTGTRVPGRLPCTAAVMRCGFDGSELELVAWGLRNAFALGFLPDGRLLAIDQGPDDRGSRPVGDAPDLLYEVRDGCWYGWPDYVGGDPITAPAYRPQRGQAPSFVLAEHHRLPAPERPLLRFPSHSAAVKFAVAPSGAVCEEGDLVVALFGDERPMTAPEGPRTGRSIVRVDPRDWSLQPLLDHPFLRPIDVAFSPVDGTLFVLDFGAFEMTTAGVAATAGTGCIWRVVP